MNVFLINLDKEKDRLAAADAQLKQLGVKYERIPAVYGKNLPQAVQDKAVDRFRWWCVVGRPCRPGEIGCALSHYSIYRRVVANGGREPVCILEDDVLLDSGFKDVLEYVGANIDCNRPQVVLLSNHCKKKHSNQSTISARNAPAVRIVKSRSDMCTEGYVITPLAAKALLKANMPMKCPCDWWGRWRRYGIIELYHAFPTVCSQERRKYSSGISSTKGLVVANLPFYGLVVHKSKRIVGLFLDRILSMFSA